MLLRILLLGAFTAVLGLVTPARADSTNGSAAAAERPTGEEAPVPDELQELFARARELHARRHWEAAYAAYLEVWRLHRSYDVAGNLAAVELQIGKPADAAAHLRFALDHLPIAESEAVSEKRERLSALFDEATQSVGTVYVQGAEVGAQLSVDGMRIARTPLEGPIFLEPGSRTLTAEANGRQRSRVLEVEPGVAYTLSFASPSPARTELQGETGAAGTATRPQNPESHRGTRWRRAVLITEGVLTLAAFATGTAFAIKSRRDSERVDELVDQLREIAPGRASSVCTEPPVSRQACAEIVRLIGDSDRSRHIARASLATGGGLALATLATWFLWRPHKSETRASPSIRLTQVAISRRFTGLVLGSEF